MLPPRIPRKSDKAEKPRRCQTRGASMAANNFLRLHADPNTIATFRTWIGEWGECWLWDGTLNERGYGYFCHAGGKITAHRAAYMLFKGPICGGLHVLHKCDVRNCVNPQHLTLGTHRDNMRDMMAKGRHVTPRGERAPSAKLNSKQVQAIRQATGPARAIATLYGVSVSTIWSIRRRDIWRHLP